MLYVCSARLEEGASRKTKKEPAEMSRAQAGNTFTTSRCFTLVATGKDFGAGEDRGGVRCCSHVSAPQDDEDEGANISNPQYHKGNNSWGLKRGPKHILSAPGRISFLRTCFWQVGSARYHKDETKKIIVGDLVRFTHARCHV